MYSANPPAEKSTIIASTESNVSFQYKRKSKEKRIKGGQNYSFYNILNIDYSKYKREWENK